MRDFIVTNGDTDSISFCKKDGSFFTKEERKKMLDELNSLYPDTIKFEADGYFPKFIVLKAKNYIYMDESGKITYKGSSLKSSTLEPRIKDFIKDIISAILEDRYSHDELRTIYHKYIREANNITDMKPWSKKLTLSEVTFKSARSNETKVIDAIKGTEYKEGDKVYLFFKEDETLSLVENFKGDYDKAVIFKKLFNATERFETILPIKEIFINYTLKKRATDLQSVCSDSS
jgi:DNA polymerase elongation subunit (family B)